MGEMTAGGQHNALTRRVLAAMGIFTGVQAMQLICGMVRYKLIALWTGCTGMALYGVLMVSLELFGTLSQTGLRTAAVRRLAAEPQRLGILAPVIRRWGWLLGGAVALLVLLLSPWLSRMSFGDGSWTWAFAVVALAVLFNSVSSTDQALLQGTGKLKAIASTTWWVYPAGLAVCVPLLYWLGDGGIAPTVTVGALLAAVAFGLMARRHVPHGAATDRRVLLREGKPLLSLGLMLSVSALVTWGATYLLMAWLDCRGGDYAVAMYQVGNTLVYRYLGLVFTALAVEYYPRLSSLPSHRAGAMNRYMRHELGLLLKVTVPMMLTFMLLLPWLIPLLYSTEMTGTLPFAALGAPATLLRAVSWCLAFCILAHGDGRLYMLTEISSAVLMLLCNTVGYTLWGIAGLGYGYLAWYTGYTAIVAVTVWRRYRIAPTARQWALTLLATAAALALTACLL